MPPSETKLIADWTPTIVQSGFNGVLVVLLLVFGRGLMLQGFAVLDRLARSVALVVLAMSFAPKEFHTQAKEIVDEVEREHKK